MKVTVLGANGRVGRMVVDELMLRNYDVVAMVHRSNPFSDAGGLQVVTGDVHNKDDVLHAVEGSDVVISTLGSWGTKQKDIVSSAAQVLVDLAAEGVFTGRVVTLTGADARMAGERPTFWQKALRPIFTIIAKKILQDGEDHLVILEESSLQWVCLRSPFMRSWGPKGYRILGLAPLPWQTIHRHSVALALVDEATKPQALSNSAHYLRGPRWL